MGRTSAYFDNLVETLRNARGVSVVQPSLSRVDDFPALARLRLTL